MSNPNIVHNPKLGALLAIIAFFIFSSNDSLLKVVTSQGGLLSNANGLNAIQVICVTAIFALIPYTLIALSRGGVQVLKLKRASIQIILLRTFFGLCNSVAVIASFSLFPMTQVYTFIFATPLLVTVLSIPFLGEKIGWRRWSATILGFIGVLVAMRPSREMFLEPLQLLPLLIPIFSSIIMIITRRALAVERSATISVWNNLFLIICVSVPAMFLWQPMSMSQFFGCAFSGILGGIAAYISMESNRFMPASQVAPFQYTQFFWGVLLDWRLFKKIPENSWSYQGFNNWVYMGALILIFSGVYTMFRAQKVRRLRFKPRARRRLWISKSRKKKLKNISYAN